MNAYDTFIVEVDKPVRKTIIDIYIPLLVKKCARDIALKIDTELVEKIVRGEL